MLLQAHPGGPFPDMVSLLDIALVLLSLALLGYVLYRYTQP